MLQGKFTVTYGTWSTHGYSPRKKMPTLPGLFHLSCSLTQLHQAGVVWVNTSESAQRRDCYFWRFCFWSCKISKLCKWALVIGFPGVPILRNNFNALRTGPNVGGNLAALFCLCELSTQSTGLGPSPLFFHFEHNIYLNKWQCLISILAMYRCGAYLHSEVAFSFQDCAKLQYCKNSKDQVLLLQIVW